MDHKETLGTPLTKVNKKVNSNEFRKEFALAVEKGRVKRERISKFLMPRTRRR